MVYVRKSEDSQGCLPIHTLFDMESLSLAAAYAKLAGSWVSKGRSVSASHAAVGWRSYRCTQVQPAFCGLRKSKLRPHVHKEPGLYFQIRNQWFSVFLKLHPFNTVVPW